MSKAIIIRTATQMAVTCGFANLTRQAIADKLDIFPSAVSFHCGAMHELKSAVMAYAVENELLTVVAQGLAARHPIALKAPGTMRARAAKILAA